MQNQKSIFQKPFVKFLTLFLAFFALTLSVVLSQSNAQNKKEPVKIFNSSKSMAPNLPKEKPIEKSNEEKSKSEQTKNTPKQEEKKKDIIPIVPSSKAPDPGQY
ncbi:MAG: hypothetical protein IPG24_01780 [Leptospiraceae bacterium]|nr:hypothetical protein [Leptospiraceae bacterium]